MASCRRLSGACLREVLGEAQGVLFDCDGVLWTGERAVPGAPELLERLSRSGKAALFVSNNSRRSVAELERRFARLGFRGVRGEQVFSSALCSALYLRRRLLGGEAGAGDSSASPPGRVFVLGGEGLRGELRDAGLPLTGEDDGGEEPPPLPPGPEALPVRAVVVGYDDQFTFAKLSEACAYLRDPQCLLVATDPDPWHPLSNGQRTPGEWRRRPAGPQEDKAFSCSGRGLLAACRVPFPPLVWIGRACPLSTPPTGRAREGVGVGSQAGFLERRPANQKDMEEVGSHTWLPKQTRIGFPFFHIYPRRAVMLQHR